MHINSINYNICVKVSLASTAHYSVEAAESLKDLNPNAADVLITSVITSMVTDIGVVSPTSGALLSYFDGSSSSFHTIDGYFNSPKNFKGNDHEEHRISMTYGGYVETCKGVNTFAIPGIYKVLNTIHDRYGSIPLSKLFEYPIELAKRGFNLPQPSKDYLRHSLEPLFMWHATSKRTLSDVYENLDSGVVVLTKLADTLEHMSLVGMDDFYIGDISKEVLSTIMSEGGHATKNDFKDYNLLEDYNFITKSKDLKLIGNAGPSIGGLMVLKYLDALQTNKSNLKENLINVYKERKAHYEFFGNREQFINNQISKITQSPSTIQVNTSDDSNNHFSITFSSGYGSGVQCKNTGMYLNNSLGEIELNPQGFLGDTKNERLISNMSPMIIQTNKGISTIGSPGADRISSALGQVILNFSNTNDWRQAINKPRFHINSDGTVRCEPGADNKFINEIVTDPDDMYFGGVCVTGLYDKLFSYGDPRRGNSSWSND